MDRDVVIVGGGVVGAAIARELTRYRLDVALLEAGPDVGAGTSKANTALLHTGFDASPARWRRAWSLAATGCWPITRRGSGSRSSAPARCWWPGTTRSAASWPASPSARAPTATRPLPM